MNRSSMPKQVMTFSNGGLASFIPKQTMINRQPHSLAYINPQEAALLKDLGGSGNPGPGGIPAYDWSWAESSLNPANWGGGGGNSSSAASTDNSSAAASNDDSGGGKYGNSRDALEAAGYTVSADGNSVYSESGQVAGANWSGSSTVNSINNAVNNVGSAGSVTSFNNDDNDNNDSGSNSITQTLANIFTPFDNQEYVNGELVDKPSNTFTQTVANIFTPFDNKEYVGGNLVDYDNYGALLPPIDGNDLASSDADGDGILDSQEFVTLFDAQSTAAANDPTGQSTGTGFIAGSDFSADIDGDGTPENYEAGTQYAVNTDGSVAVAGSAEDLTGGMSQLDSALVNQGLAQDYDGDGVISFDETFGAESTVSSGTGTDTTGGGDDGGSDTTNGGDDGSEEGGDDTTTAPPSSLNFRFYGGYQPRTREDVLVASPGANLPFVMPDDPRITPIYTPGDNIDTTLSPTATGSTEGYGTAALSPIPETTTTVPVFGQPGTIATPGPEMPGQGQFATMQELMEFQQKYPSLNLMGEYQRLKALEGGAVQPAVLPQRGIASLMGGDPATEAMYQGIMS